jgi:hypothetical protein
MIEASGIYLVTLPAKIPALNYLHLPSLEMQTFSRNVQENFFPRGCKKMRDEDITCEH